MKNNQKGFSVVELVLLIMVAGLVGGVGWYVWNQGSDIAQQDVA
jgi:type II secretory pathway pseudopilin PulG